ncbi:hypothetical protein [Rubritalea tangerina]|uniref:DUF4469 domain-containing protein n=1 Tax=Rubritalea tangerina TaxID=430798 RepID=A0ABW4ZFI2_9BACT
MRSTFALVITSLLCSTAPICLAQDSFDPTGHNTEAHLPKIIRTQVEYIVIPTSLATQLMYGPKKAANDSALRLQLQKLLDDKKATMLDSQMVTCRSGEKATTESVRELIYPTEYEPAEVPKEVHIDGKNVTAAKEKLITPPTPTAFETRNIGSTLELEPTLSDNGIIIELRFAPEITYHVEDNVLAEFRDERGIADIKVPTIYTLRINTGMTLESGKYHLAAMLSPKTDKGFTDSSKKVFVFVKSDALTVSR